MRRFTALGAAGALVGASLSIAMGASSAGAAVGDDPCPIVPVPILVVSDGTNPVLRTYDSVADDWDDMQLTDESNAALGYSIGDIAISADGSVLYAVPFTGAPVGTQLWTFDPVSGERTGIVPITGLPAGYQFINGLSMSEDGRLILGAAGRTDVYHVNPSTGAATLFSNLSSPTVTGSAGDFLTLPDRDVLAVMGAGANTELVRIAPDGTWTSVAVQPGSFYGAALSEGDLFLASSTGELERIALSDIPTTASTAPVPSVQASAPLLGSFYGATSIQDAGCQARYTVAKSATVVGGGTTVAQGGRIDYSVVITNTSAFSYPASAQAGIDDDLSGVLSVGTVVPGSLVAESGTASIVGGSVVWSGNLAAAGSPGHSVTVTYSVDIGASSTGSAMNSVTPTGFGGSCASPTACAVSTAIVATTTTTSTTAPPTTSTTSPPPTSVPSTTAAAPTTGMPATTAAAPGTPFRPNQPDSGDVDAARGRRGTGQLPTSLALTGSEGRVVLWGIGFVGVGALALVRRRQLQSNE